MSFNHVYHKHTMPIIIIVQIWVKTLGLNVLINNLNQGSKGNKHRFL
jgi:hypothetical protein